MTINMVNDAIIIMINVANFVFVMIIIMPWHVVKFVMRLCP